MGFVYRVIRVWWKFIQIYQYYTMALISIFDEKACYVDEYVFSLS